jgi:hypothetical protein
MSVMTGSMTTTSLVILPVQQLNDDPHGTYRRYRPLVPFIAHDAGAYIVLRAKDVETLMRDPRVRQPETELPELLGFTEGPVFDSFKYSMLTSNGDIHRRRRAPFTRTFAARLIADLRPRIRKMTEELIDAWQAEGEVDFVEHFAALVPARTISAMLDLPIADISYFTSLVYSVSRIFSFTCTPAELKQIEADTAALRDYVETLLKSRRGGDADDFLSHYLATADEKGELSPVEIVTQIVILIIGGTDTTRVALAILVALLLEQRDRWDAVCRDPALIPGAVTESLRYEPSVGSTARYTLEDIELDGHILPAGKFVLLSTMSAMRDDAAHRQPDVFDMQRPDLRRALMVFGGGPHRCLGEALSWTELEEALAALTTRLPQLRLAGPMPRVHGFSGIRRIDEMRLAWDVR